MTCSINNNVLGVQYAKAPCIVTACSLASTVIKRGVIKSWYNSEWCWGRRIGLVVAIDHAVRGVLAAKTDLNLRCFCLNNPHVNVLRVRELVLIENIVLRSCADTGRC